MMTYIEILKADFSGKIEANKYTSEFIDIFTWNINTIKRKETYESRSRLRSIMS